MRANIKVQGQERFRYWAVDSTGQNIDFLPTVERATAAAKRFLQKGSTSPDRLKHPHKEEQPGEEAAVFCGLTTSRGCVP
jgi:DDE superfamily endonuclease